MDLIQFSSGEDMQTGRVHPITPSGINHPGDVPVGPRKKRWKDSLIPEVVFP